MRLLDLFCGAGGAAMGYYRAGFTEIVGVDIKPQPHYPFRFVQADLSAWRVVPHGFHAVHASPPCQSFSKTRAILRGKGLTNKGVDLVAHTRAMLRRNERPYVIENVPGAPLESPIMLCGTMFGCRVYRHRLFECSDLLLAPTHGEHEHTTGSHRGYSKGTPFITVGGNNYNREQGAMAMGIDWPMTRAELSQSIPPAYTEFIGRQLIQSLRAEVA
jgi:DNA (cytosine-5)-methyltransferase 1